MTQLRDALHMKERDIHGQPITIMGRTFIPVLRETKATVLGKTFKVRRPSGIEEQHLTRGWNVFDPRVQVVIVASLAMVAGMAATGIALARWLGGRGIDTVEEP
jgi:hypothetical protein